MKTKEREYLGKAEQHEERAKQGRCSDREWHLILARTYRILAEKEREVAAQRQVAAA